MIQRSSIGERSVALAMLGAVAFSPPLLAIVQLPTLVFGIPLLYVYLFAVWAVIIALLARTAGRWVGPEDVDSPSGAPPDGAADT